LLDDESPWLVDEDVPVEFEVEVLPEDELEKLVPLHPARVRTEDSSSVTSIFFFIISLLKNDEPLLYA